MHYEKGKKGQKLNVGCGKDVREGWVNLEMKDLPGVDMVYDITKLPLPFEDGDFSEILCNDILEHVEYVPILKDLHRVLQSGGHLHVRVPHFTSKNNPIDPTHIRTFSIETLGFFVRTEKVYRDAGSYMFDFAFSAYAEPPRIDFERSRRALFLNRFVEPWVNKNYSRQQLYEATGISRLFPAQNILVTFRK